VRQGDGTRWDGVAFGLALAVLATFQQYKLPPLLPVLLERYGYDPVLAGGFMSVYALIGLVLSVHAGRALERAGFLLVQAACAAFALGSALTLVAPESGVVVLAARAIEGVGYAVLAIAGPALANRSAGPAQLAFVAGVAATWVPVGQLLANAITLPAADSGAWRVPWAVATVAPIVIALWARRMEARGHGFGAAASAEVPLPREERRTLVLASLVFMAWSGQYIAFMSWLNTYLVGTLGLGGGVAVGAASVAAFAVLVFNVATGAAFRAGLALGPVFVGSIVIEAGVWLVAPHVTGGGGIALLAVYGIACGVTPVCLFAMPALIVGRERVGGGAFGVLMRGRNLGVFAGPLLLPVLAGTRLGWDVVWPTFGALTLAAAVGALVLTRRLAALRAPGGSRPAR
jgi:MFS family permease